MSRKLAYEDPRSFGPSGPASASRTIIYVLGGNQETLTHRFRKASSLYHQGFARKILILSRPGITEFSPELGRNLTNDEWATRELERLDVRREDVEPVSIRTGLFGTLSEAKALPAVARSKGIERLILVTSTYHTMRAFVAFSHFAERHRLELFICGSGEKAGLTSLLSEYLKLRLYGSLILPVNDLVEKREGASKALFRFGKVGSSQMVVKGADCS